MLELECNSGLCSISQCVSGPVFLSSGAAVTGEMLVMPGQLKYLAFAFPTDKSRIARPQKRANVICIAKPYF